PVRVGVAYDALGTGDDGHAGCVDQELVCGRVACVSRAIEDIVGLADDDAAELGKSGIEGQHFIPYAGKSKCEVPAEVPCPYRCRVDQQFDALVFQRGGIHGRAAVAGGVGDGDAGDDAVIRLSVEVGGFETYPVVEEFGFQSAFDFIESFVLQGGVTQRG